MSNSIKDENFKSWKKRIDLILEKNKVLDLVKGNVNLRGILRSKMGLLRSYKIIVEIIK